MVMITDEILNEIVKRINLKVELFKDNLKQDLIIREYVLPLNKYNHDKVDILIKVPNTYPRCGLDMFWVSPILKLKASDSLPSCCEVNETLHDMVWQRWSRHYEWNPSKNDIFTHIDIVEECLSRE